MDINTIEVSIYIYATAPEHNFLSPQGTDDHSSLSINPRSPTSHSNMLISVTPQKELPSKSTSDMVSSPTNDVPLLRTFTKLPNMANKYHSEVLEATVQMGIIL